MTRARSLRHALACVAIGSAGAASAEAHAADTILSDERTETRWAHSASTAKVRSAPRADARTRGRLRLTTEDGLPEVYLALRSRKDESGREWIQIRMLGRPNGRKGWVIRNALGGFNVVRTHLTIDRRRLRATLRRRGRVVWRSRIGIGTRATPTPAGSFYVRERLPGGGGAYGPWAFGTSAYSSLSDWPGGGVIGVHGTNQPQLIPGRPSHGCVRVPNRKIRRLARIMPIGTPIEVR